MKTIFRIENTNSDHGLWYNNKGEYDPSIHIICPEGISREMPMDYSGDHRKNGKIWYSSARSIENLLTWFSKEDVVSLVAHGYRLLELRVTEWQEKEFETLFTKESVISARDIDLKKLWGV